MSTVYFQTHPSQKCFMSSVDLHTHYSRQVIDSISVKATVIIMNVYGFGSFLIISSITTSELWQENFESYPLKSHPLVLTSFDIGTCHIVLRSIWMQLFKIKSSEFQHYVYNCWKNYKNVRYSPLFKIKSSELPSFGVFFSTSTKDYAHQSVYLQRLQMLHVIMLIWFRFLSEV